MSPVRPARLLPAPLILLLAMLPCACTWVFPTRAPIPSTRHESDAGAAAAPGRGAAGPAAGVLPHLAAGHLAGGNGCAAVRAGPPLHPCTEQEIVNAALRIFGQGAKVCVELAAMVADAGLVCPDEEIVAVAGTASGADTACVVRPMPSNRLFEIKVREFLCKPGD